MTPLEESLCEELRLVRKALVSQTKLIDSLYANVEIYQKLLRDDTAREARG